MRSSIVLVSSAALAACSSIPNLPPAPQVAAPLAVNYSTPSYTIQTGDLLAVSLLVNPELDNTDVLVRSDGHISTKVVPDAIAAGLTVPELTAVLNRAYSKQLQNPSVTVMVKSSQPSRIYVAGEVVTPGEYVNTMGLPLSLSQAIARAGGTKPTGDNSSVFIIRKTASNTPEFLSTRYSSVMYAKDPTAEVSLAPYDVVVVPKTGIAEVYGYWNQYVEQFVHPSFGFSYLLNPGTTSSVVQAAPR